MPTLTIRPLSRLVALLALCALPLSGLVAGDTTTDNKDKKDTTQNILDDITPLNDFSAEGSYVGESGFRIRRFSGDGPSTQQSYGHMDESQEEIEFARRIHLVDRLYLKLGAQYERFDFGTTQAPLPTSLQSIAGVVALEYVVQGKPALFITSNPGIYFSDTHDLSMGNFDAPTSIGGIVPLAKKFYLLLGARFSILAKEPVYPILGVVWLISDHLRLEAVPPEPRLIYSVNEKLDFFAGGELLGDAYKRDDTNFTQRGEKRFSGGVIDFTEFRAGGGLTYSPIKQIDIDLSGGWDFERDFDYYRGSSKRFVTDGAPYAKVKISAEF